MFKVCSPFIVTVTATLSKHPSLALIFNKFHINYAILLDIRMMSRFGCHFHWRRHGCTKRVLFVRCTLCDSHGGRFPQGLHNTIIQPNQVQGHSGYEGRRRGAAERSATRGNKRIACFRVGNVVKSSFGMTITFLIEVMVTGS